ncbi:hypothetical protein [Asanoa siamensis]|uniref:Uncharacterized protein n=1 Tax=Asanoa siamensis TaxID=926357 RepID=A0ABQ4CKU7_9ACTN|nr:hypothetical protein [Asanoa siamensis]GIF71907.1 hypothetical protein Asi02nite_14250 [Asanoa siamensis]
MGWVHGKKTVLILNGVDISAYCNTSEFERNADKHDTTTYGKDDHEYDGGLGDGAASCGGLYDNTAAGPRDTIEPLVGTKVTLVRRPEGTGAGLPQDSVTVLIEKYVETSPVAEYVAWSCTMQPSGAVTSTNQ